MRWSPGADAKCLCHLMRTSTVSLYLSVPLPTEATTILTSERACLSFTLIFLDSCAGWICPWLVPFRGSECSINTNIGTFSEPASPIDGYLGYFTLNVPGVNILVSLWTHALIAYVRSPCQPVGISSINKYSESSLYSLSPALSRKI